ncbi:MAG: PAS domain-containing protein [Deltaproteobacteria bacterium]|nr:PAS domain-containing protein [Deltaproteobacteria bacterium]
MPEKPTYEELTQKNNKLEKEVSKLKHIKDCNEQYQELLDVSHVVIYKCKPYGKFSTTFITENIIRQMGYKPVDFTSNPEFWSKHIHKDDRPQVFTNFANLLEKESLKHEYRFLHSNGLYYWIHDELKLIRDKDGNPTDIIGNCYRSEYP